MNPRRMSLGRATAAVLVPLLYPLLGLVLAPALAAPVGDQVVVAFNSISPSPEIPQHGVLLQAKDGNFYGLTQNGGIEGLGTAFKVTPAGTLSLLHSFTREAGGGGFDPDWGLVQAKNGDLYGTTNNSPDGSGGHGTMFRLSTTGTYTLLHNFVAAEGGMPNSTLVTGPNGLLYGTTSSFGTWNGGTVFRIAPDGTKFEVITQFHCAVQAAGPCNPTAGLTLGADGAIYGITMAYTDDFGNNGYGAVYRVNTTGAVTLLHAFTYQDGALDPPVGVPAQDAAGNLYFYGGPRNSQMSAVVYKLDPVGKLSVLYEFTQLGWLCSPDNPELHIDQDSRIYGVFICAPSSGHTGVAFSLTTDGSMQILHEYFDDGQDVTSPQIPFVHAKDGSMWSMTGSGTPLGNGGVYRLNPPQEKLKLKPTTINAGQQATLRWTSSDTTDCTASGAWAGAQTTTGKVTVAPAVAGSYTYTLSCSGAGTTERAVTLTVK